ncbi:MAG: hypothetical protein OXE58_10145, partial [Acidobacteria bacterium]|nr:hypothetical protein [Acidobacteriota bacterium]
MRARLLLQGAANRDPEVFGDPDLSPQVGTLPTATAGGVRSVLRRDEEPDRARLRRVRRGVRVR